MKILKSRKALSPVVASIILIAVTVAVSIAVAAWMGALSFTFMATEEIQFTTHSWETATPPTYIQITVKNTGSGNVRIDEVRKGDSNGTWAVITGSRSLDPSTAATASATYQLTLSGIESGVKYNFYVVTSRGNIFGPYQKIAP